MKTKTRNSSKSGAALVEAALTIPFLLSVFLGILIFSFGFASYAITTLDVVSAFVVKETFNYKGTLTVQKIVHGHNGGASLNLNASSQSDLAFANLASGRASSRREPFGVPNNQDGNVTYVYSTAEVQHPSNALQLYSVKRTFIPWVRGMENLHVTSTIASPN